MKKVEEERAAVTQKIEKVEQEIEDIHQEISTVAQAIAATSRLRLCSWPVAHILVKDVAGEKTSHTVTEAMTESLGCSDWRHYRPMR